MSRTAYERVRPGILTTLLIITGSCQPASFEGTYRDQSGLTQYRFDGRGEVELTVLGNEHLASYEVDGDRILLRGANGILVLRRVEDDRLAGPMGLLLVRSETGE